jgi:hypothetical protein
MLLARDGRDTASGSQAAASTHMDGNPWRSTAVEIGGRTLGPRALRSWYTVPEEESEPSSFLLATEVRDELSRICIPCGPFEITDTDATLPSQERWPLPKV